MSTLVERLRACADDPMWADHAEIPKSWCSEAADEISRLRGTAAEYDAWIRFHDAGNGDFRDFIRIVATNGAEVLGPTVELSGPQRPAQEYANGTE